MIVVDSPPDPTCPPSLAALSRNASAISTSSSDSLPISPVITPRPRPIRNFSAPRSKSPHSASPQAFKHPQYLAKELGYADNSPNLEPEDRSRSKSRNRNVGATPEDFKFGATLGEGSYSTVKQATHIRSGQQYAIKVLEKSHLIRKGKMSTALSERYVLSRLGTGHPGIVHLYYAFQDEWRLYFVLDLARNGEMQTLISRMGSLSLQCARYYTAQIVDAVEYMHSKGVIHRDLKPENILLDEHFRIKITDFGTGKILDPGMERAETWVGTAQYIAPELLEAKETSKSSDFWALGCIIYQIIAGRFAFQGLSEYLTWQKIKQLEYSFPEGFDEQAEDLVRRLLVREPAQRLGAGLPGTHNDINTLRTHPFFSSINWNTLWTDAAPPLEPGLYKRDKLPDTQDVDWKDIGSTWDHVSGSDSDEIAWEGNVAKSEAPVAALPSNVLNPLVMASTNTNDAVGPPSPQSESHILSDSLEQSPVADLSSMVVSLNLATDPMSNTMQQSVVLPDDERGRKAVLSPVQGNGPADFTALVSILKLPGSEEILFCGSVEARSLLRRASRLIPLPVPPSRPKTRQLVLTTRRLLCLKQLRNADGITIKTELTFQASDKLKEKDKERESRGIISSIDRKGEREFVILTSSKTYHYAAKDAESAKLWCQKITATLQHHGRSTNKS